MSNTDAARERPAEPFRYCLNTSTLRGQRVPLPELIEIAARAGYQAIEPWIRELDEYVQAGGSLRDLRQQLADHGLAVPSAIGFFEWIVDDDGRRAKALEEAKRSMDLVRQIGGQGIAAPPFGATDRADLPLLRAAERYRALLEIGDQLGVTPYVEVWGFSQCLRRLGEAALVAIEANHPRASILPDVYHLYKGGSDYGGLRLLGGAAMHAFHVNDYPARPTRAEIADKHRVYPGDGIAPLDRLFRDLRDLGFRGYLSLELFNEDYWRQDAFQVAKTGLEKTRAAVRRALG